MSSCRNYVATSDAVEVDGFDILVDRIDCAQSGLVEGSNVAAWYFDTFGGDVSKWSVCVFQDFIINILGQGVRSAIKETRDQIARELEEFHASEPPF